MAVEPCTEIHDSLDMTTEPTHRAYTPKQFRRAVNLSAVLGLVMVIATLMLELQSVEMLFYGAIFGLPIAFLTCWIAVAPLLHIVMKHNISWVQAAIYGALITFILCAAWIGFFHLRALYWWPSNQGSQLGYGEYLKSINGIRTVYGWKITAKSVASLMAVSAAIALVVRAIIGPGETK